MDKRERTLFRRRALLVLIVLIPIGLMTKWYSGPCVTWTNNYAGGLLYEVFWCLVIAFLWPRFSAVWISTGVLAATSLLEFLQLWQHPFLMVIRSHFIGRTLIGSSFSWLDFPNYLAGCVLGWALIRFLKIKAASASSQCG
jgi:hypothetical protein